MTSTRPHLRRRRLIGSALAAAVLFAGAMSACSPNTSQLQSTALSASQVKERISKTPTSTDDDALPVGEDYLYVSAPELTEKEKAQRGRQDRSGPNSSIVARYRGSDGSVLWPSSTGSTTTTAALPRTLPATSSPGGRPATPSSVPMAAMSPSSCVHRR